MGWKEEARQELKELAKGNTFKFVEGENTFRVLPNKKDKTKAPFRRYLAHSGVGPRNQFVRCGKNRQGEGSCWLCDVKIPELVDSGKPGLAAKAEDLRPIEQVVFQFAWIEDGHWRGPKPFYAKMGKTRALANRIIAFISKSYPYDDPIKGKNLTLTRTGLTKNNTQYGDISADDDASKVPDNILAKTKLFSELVGDASPEYQMQIYKGEDVPEDTTELEAAAAEALAEENTAEVRRAASENVITEDLDVTDTTDRDAGDAGDDDDAGDSGIEAGDGADDVDSTVAEATDDLDTLLDEQEPVKTPAPKKPTAPATQRKPAPEQKKPIPPAKGKKRVVTVPDDDD